MELLKGILNYSHSSWLEVQVTYFFGAENFPNRMSEPLSKNLENSWRLGTSPEDRQSEVLHPILEKKVVVIRNFASGSPRTNHSTLISFPLGWDY